MKCAECKVIADCKHTFGIYWAYKSNMGTGCKYPIKGWSHKAPPPPMRPREVRQEKFV